MVRRAVQQKRSDNDFNARNEDRSLQGAAAWKGYQQQILKAKERTPAKTERMDCVLIPVAHRFFADTNRGSNITFERCPFHRKRGEGLSLCVFLCILSDQVAHHCTFRIACLRKLQPFLQSQALDVNTTFFALWYNHCGLHLVRTRTWRPISSGELSTAAFSIITRPLIAQREQLVLRIYCRSCLFARCAAAHPVQSAASPAEHRHQRFFTVQPLL